jgi:cell division transport system ATP-binding protein
MLFAEVLPSEGSVFFGSQDIAGLRNGDLLKLRRNIGTIFQDFRLLQTKNVYENIAFALEVSGVSSREIRDRVRVMLETVGMPAKGDNFPNELSGGEQQRVVIARALVHRPKMLLADEPTGNLDAINAGEITDLLVRINAFGTTVILVTHNREMVNVLRRRVITLHEGMVASDHKHGKYTLPV